MNISKMSPNAPNAIASINVVTRLPRTPSLVSSSQQKSASDGTISGLEHNTRIFTPKSLPSRFATDESMNIAAANFCDTFKDFITN